MKPSIYVETTIPSYLTARPSRDLVMMANQQIAREWWDRRRGQFELFISQLVLDEVSAGDAGAASSRLELLRDIPLLAIDDACRKLGRSLFDGIPLPPKAATDALHVAVATVNGMDYMLTWNCKHLANATLRTRIESICEAAGLMAPVICTPQDLLEE